MTIDAPRAACHARLVNMPIQTRPALMATAIILIILWSSAFTFVSVGVRSLSPIWLVAGRLSIGAIVLGGIAVASRHSFPKLRDVRWLYYGALGLTGAVFPFFLVAQGQLKVDSGLSAIIIAAMPLFTIVLAHAFADEKLTPVKSVGFIIGFIGVIILFLPDRGALGLTEDWRSQLLILAGAFCYAVTTVAAKRAPETPSAIGAAIMMIVAALVTVIAALIFDTNGFTPSTMGWVSIIALGLGSTGVATILYLYFINEAGPSAMARLNYVVPLASVLLGVWFLQEPLTWKVPIAFLVIFAGVVISRIGQAVPNPPAQAIATEPTGADLDQTSI